ncbi:MAG: UPF0164 family protein, partial [Myxococcota bacterium]
MNPFKSISTAIVHSSCVWAIAVAVIVFVGSSLVGSGPQAQAQNSSNGNYNATIIGGRPASMGGAFTGLADDSSAIVHNPAGLAQLSTSGISLSVTAYGFERTSVDNAFLFSEIEDLGIPETSVTTTIDSLLLFPATLAWVYPLGQTEGGFQHTAAF